MLGESGKLIVKVQDTDNSRQIVTQSTFLSFKTVKDNFGKKFAQSFFVVQVDIRNERLDKQFIVQTIDVIIDPNQCRNGPEIYRDFDVTKCKELFEANFKFPNAQQSVRREEVIATGKADLNRSNHNIAFRSLAFSANFGTILGGFSGLLGRDAVKGVGILGTTFTDAAKALFPDTAGEKLENLKNALPTEDVIIRSKESKTFNIFIPTERIFWKESWGKYTKSVKDSDADTYQLKVVLDLVLLSSATGVLVDNEATEVRVTSADSVEKLAKKFDIKPDRYKEAAATSETINRILSNWESSLDTADTRRKIINALTAFNNKDKSGNIRLTKAISFNKDTDSTRVLYDKLHAAKKDVFNNGETDTENLSTTGQALILEQLNKEILQILQMP